METYRLQLCKPSFDITPNKKTTKQNQKPTKSGAMTDAPGGKKGNEKEEGRAGESLRETTWE